MNIIKKNRMRIQAKLYDAMPLRQICLNLGFGNKLSLYYIINKFTCKSIKSSIENGTLDGQMVKIFFH